MAAQQLQAGLTCSFVFETQVSGQVKRVGGRAKVVYAILSGTEGFRTGLSIVDIDPASNKTLAELML